MKRLFQLAGLGLVVLLSSSTRADALPFTPPWEIVPGDSWQCAYTHTVVPLEDGRAFVVGGCNAWGAFQLFDGETESWIDPGPMVSQRTGYHFAARLADGRVLVGGGYGPAGYLSAAELFDPLTDTSSATTALPYGLIYASAVTLLDGRVLIVGGERMIDGATSGHRDTLIYLPETAQWVVGPPIAIHREATTLTLLDDGRVLIAGGLDLDTNTMTTVAELFVPGNDTTPDRIEAAAPMPHGRVDAVSGRLGDGRVLFAGGQHATQPWTAFASADLYDPNTNTWEALPPMSIPRLWAMGAVLLDGSFLVAGGTRGSTELWRAPVATVERYDPLLEQWVSMPPMPSPRHRGKAAMVGDVLLIAGGIDDFTADGHSFMLSFKNVAPVAVASAAQDTVLGVPGYAAAVVVSAAGSYDDDEGDVLTYTWTEGASTLAVTVDPITEATLGLAIGTHELTLTVTDRYGVSDTASVTVTVVDANTQGQAQLTQCLADNAALEDQLDQADADNAELEDQLDQAAADKAALQALLDQANAEKAALQTQLDSALDDVAAAEATRDQCLLDQADAEAERDQCLAGSTELAARIDELQALLDEALDELAGGQTTAGHVVDRIQTIIRLAIPDPDFVVPGATPREQLERLLDAIEALPRGAIHRLYKALDRR